MVRETQDAWRNEGNKMHQYWKPCLPDKQVLQRGEIIKETGAWEYY
jgi:hypothetical protein